MWYMHVCIRSCKCVYACVCMYMWRQRLMLGASLKCAPSFWDTLREPGAQEFLRMAGSHTPGIYPLCSLRTGFTPGLYIGAGDPHSCPHAVTHRAEPSLQHHSRRGTVSQLSETLNHSMSSQTDCAKLVPPSPSPFSFSSLFPSFPTSVQVFIGDYNPGKTHGYDFVKDSAVWDLVKLWSDF